jgi:hypothetical protein
MTTPPLVGGSLTPSDVEALRKVAEEATPGPWEELHNTAGPMGIITGQDGELGPHPTRICWLEINNYEHANATFIALANPQAILSLLEKVKEADEANISLDSLPFWPWLWANPFLDDPDEQEEATERRVRANYETAREPVPNQFAILHRADINRLVHALWRKRALASIVQTFSDRAEAAELALSTLKRERDEARRALSLAHDLCLSASPKQAVGEVLSSALRSLALLSGRVGGSSGGRVQAAPDGATEAQHSAGQDTARLDWLETQCVEVRTPLVHGSRAKFSANPDDSYEGEVHPSDLRTKIDAALKFEEIAAYSRTLGDA